MTGPRAGAPESTASLIGSTTPRQYGQAIHLPAAGGRAFEGLSPSASALSAQLCCAGNPTPARAPPNHPRLLYSLLRLTCWVRCPCRPGIFHPYLSTGRPAANLGERGARAFPRHGLSVCKAGRPSHTRNHPALRWPPPAHWTCSFRCRLPVLNQAAVPSRDSHPPPEHGQVSGVQLGGVG